MNYSRARKKIKEKNAQLKKLSGSERERAEKLLIQQAHDEENQKSAEPKEEEKEDKAVSKNQNKGKNHGSKPRG